MPVGSNVQSDQTEELVELADLATHRSQIYKLLAALFLRRPDREFVESLNRFFQSGIVESHTSADKGFGRGLEAMRDYLESYDPEDTELIVEFTRLLRGFRPDRLPRPPYESVYRGEPQVFGHLTAQVSEEYRDVGLEVADEYKGEPPDHIGIELNFMGYLCETEAKAWLDGGFKKALSYLAREETFLEAHLLLWLPNLCRQLTQHSDTAFYRGVAKSAKSWVKFDYEQIRATVRSH